MAALETYNNSSTLQSSSSSSSFFSSLFLSECPTKRPTWFSHHHGLRIGLPFPLPANIGLDCLSNGQLASALTDFGDVSAGKANSHSSHVAEIDVLQRSQTDRHQGKWDEGEIIRVREPNWRISNSYTFTLMFPKKLHASANHNNVKASD